MSGLDAAKPVSSWAFPPLVLAAIRLLIAVFTLVVLIYQLVWSSTTPGGEVEGYFSYFTNLTFIGLCAYFFASGVQTLCYALNVRKGKQGYPLKDSWPKVLQYLHILLLSTIVTYPILVTIVYWVLLADADSFATPYTTFSNIVKHALNSVFALFEIIFTNVGPMPWKDLPVCVLMLSAYLGVAYITHETQGFYTYSFLDPKKQGKLLAAYIIGIAVGVVVLFVIVWGIIKLRERFTAKARATDAAKTQEKIAEHSQV